MGPLLIVLAIVIGAAAWEISTEVGGEYLAMYMIDPTDFGASNRVPDTLQDGTPRPSGIVQGEVSDVLLAAYDPTAAPVLPASVTEAANDSPGPSVAEIVHDGGVVPASATLMATLAPAQSDMVDASNGDSELTSLLALIGDTPHRQLDGTVFMPITAQRVFGLHTVLGERVSVPTTYELPGRTVINPASSALVQVSNDGFIEALKGRYPFVGQSVKRGDLLAFLRPVNDHLEEAHTLERIQELTNQIDITRKRMARLEEVIYVRYRGSKIEAMRVEIVGLQRQLDVLQGAIEARYELRAMTDGIVSRVEAQVGQYVQQGTTIFEIVDPTGLWVEATAFEPQQSRNILDASAFTADGRKLDLRFIGGGLRLSNQATPLWFEVINPGPNFALDNPVSVVVRNRDGDVTGVRVPRSALSRNADGRQFIWERRSAERFVGHHVSSQPIDAEHVLVTEGLSANVRVVVEGAAALDQVR